VGLAGLGGYWGISEQNLEITRRFVEAFDRDGPDGLIDLLDPEVEYVEDPKFPQAGVYRGRDAVLRQWREFWASFEDYHVEVEDRFAVGDRVVTICRESGRGAASGVPVNRPTGYVHTFRAGKVVRVEIFLDPADALEAVGGRP
jgi:ketosteroid isomerase-like protein